MNSIRFPAFVFALALPLIVTAGETSPGGLVWGDCTSEFSALPNSDGGATVDRLHLPGLHLA
jgi:hypothetical protein